jgi:uncharacterized protein (TIGR03435 family)
MRNDLLALGAFGSRSRLRGRIEALLAHGRVFLPSASLARAGASAAVLLTLGIGASFTPRWIAFAQRLEFEVASIRPHQGPVTVSGGSFTPPPTFRYMAVKLTDLVTHAYGVWYEQVAGAPSWGDGPGAARYDVEAKVEDDAKPSREQVQQMLRSLLEDRFKLKVRRETREKPVYLLTVAKRGPKVKSVDKAAGVKVGASAIGRRIDGKATMDFLAQQLTINAGRIVIDRTGLTGNYEFTLEWTPDGSEPSDGAASVSIFTAVQEQLGLKLEPAKAPVEMIVIERAEMPTEN